MFTSVHYFTICCVTSGFDNYNLHVCVVTSVYIITIQKLVTSLPRVNTFKYVFNPDI